MHMHSIPSGFGKNNTSEPKLLWEGSIQPPRITLSICLWSSASSCGEMWYGERNGILPFGSVLISKLACLPLGKFANVGSLQRPWISVHISWNSPSGSSVWSVPPSPWWCILIRMARFSKPADTVLNSAFRILCMPIHLACSTVRSLTSKGHRPGK